MCAVVWWVHISTCFWEKWMSSSQSQRPKGPSRLSSATDAKASICHGMVVQQSQLAYVRNWHMTGICAKVPYTGIVQRHAAIKMMPFTGRPWLDQDNARYHSECATTVWFRRDRVNVLDWPACSLHLSPIENVWLIMKRRIRQRHSRTAEHLKSWIKQDWTKILLAKL